MRTALARAWFRTLVVQASFNHDRLVGVGSAFAIEPLLRRLPGGPDGEQYKAAMRRATQFFNAHPYMVGLAIGAVAKAERQGVSGDAIRRLRHALIGPLGSIGDKLIWAGVLPVSAGVGLVVMSLVSPVAGVIAFLGLFNAVHITLRTWGLREGWRLGTNVSQALTAKGIQRGLRLAGPLAALAVGMALPIVGEWLTEGFTLRTQVAMVLVALVALVFSRWVVPTFGGLRFGLAAAAVAIVIGWIA
jgi:PTS system mannose-specific IID component